MSIPTLHEAHLGSAADAQKDRYGFVPYPHGEGSNGVSRKTVKCNGLGGYVVAETGGEVRLGGSTFNPQESHPRHFVSQHNDSGLNHNPPGICSSNGNVKNTLTSATEVSAKSPLPPFEFYVSSEQGISLCVDLDSSPLDWIESLKNEVNICHNWRGNKSHSLHQDLVRYKDSDTENGASLRNTDACQLKNREVTEENGDLGVNLPNCMVNVLEELEEDHSLTPSKSFSDSKNQRRSESDTRPADMKSMCSSHVKSISCGPCVTSSEQPSSNLRENTTVANGVSQVNCAAFPVFSANCSMEIQLSEVASYNTPSSPCKNGGLSDMVDPKQERSKNINRMDSSECSQLISFGSNVVRSDGFESHEKRCRKRPRIDGEVQSDCSQPDTRGRKRRAGKLLPRRSLRLVTK